ncbi:MAG: hypothetical protein OHK0056_10520 [Bacteriovoracaceae bacterium]
MEWKAHPKIPTMILPKKESETLEQAVARYLQFLKSNPDMQKMMVRDQLNLDDLKVGEVKIFDPQSVKKSFSPYFLFMANRFNDFKPSNPRIAEFFPFMTQHGAIPYMLPVSADGGLKAKDAEDYRKLVSGTFDVLFGMGGDDVHPELYGEEITYASVNDLNKTRDISEIKLIQEYIKKEKGVYYGVCRGSQICAVAKKEKLVQDLRLEQGVTKGHKHEVHSIDIHPREDNLIRAFIGSEKEKMDIMSRHHQAVKPTKNMRIDVIASADHGTDYVIEAYQFKNGLGLAFQFHPESLIQNDDNQMLMQGMIDYAAFVKKQKLLNQNCDNLIMGFIGR